MKTAKEIAEEAFPRNIFPSHGLRNELEAKINQFKKEVLTDFLDFLLKNGYCDTDVYYEPPTAIDQYLIPKLKT